MNGAVTSPGAASRAIKRKKQRDVTAMLERRGFARKVESWIEHQVENRSDWKEAAIAVGLPQKHARALSQNPAIMGRMRDRVQLIRAGEGLMNLHVAKTIRDRALDNAATAAQQRVSLDAVKYIDPEERGGAGVHVSVGVQLGYVMDLSGPVEGPRRLSSTVIEAHAEPAAAEPFHRVQLGVRERGPAFRGPSGGRDPARE